MFEIIFHGRAGQGAKSAGEFLAAAALARDKFFQTFPNYGPERTGAPMVAFVRISDDRIKSYSPITQPDVVAVIDDSLLSSIQVTEGLKQDGILLVNTKNDKSHVKDVTGFKGKIFTIDATSIALEHLGKNIPNTAILGAIVKLTDVVDLGALIEKIREKFTKKIGEEKTSKNIEAVKAGYEDVQ